MWIPKYTYIQIYIQPLIFAYVRVYIIFCRKYFSVHMLVVLSVMHKSHHDAAHKAYDNYDTLCKCCYYFNVLHFCVLLGNCTAEAVAWKNHRFPCRSCILHLWALWIQTTPGARLPLRNGRLHRQRAAIQRKCVQIY